MIDQLRHTVFNFVDMIQDRSVSDLEIEWSWKGYNEGVRFANFRVYEELCQLAAKLRDARQKIDSPISTAQYVLGQHHIAYFDFRALLLGLEEGILDKDLNNGEWTLRKTIKHIIEGEWAFVMAIETGLDCIRNGIDQKKFTKDDWTIHFTERGNFTDESFENSLPKITKLYDHLHRQVAELFSNIQDKELEQKIIFWEEELLSVRFRLQRFDSHLRQHTIQAEKILRTNGHKFTEARSLSRLILNALAEVESALFGNREIGKDLIMETNGEIAALKTEIQELLSLE